MSTPTIALLPSQQGVLFDEHQHRYSIYSDRLGQWLHPPSVSQILTVSEAKGFDPTYWRKSLIQRDGMRPDEAETYMELHRNGRADVGTELHALIRAELLGEPYHPRIAESLKLLAVWRREFLPRIEQVLLLEQPIISRWAFYSGTPDLLALIEGRWLILDWKTKVSEAKAKPDTAWRWQLGGYDGLISDQYGITVDGAANLMIWPEGVKAKSYNRADLDVFRAEFYGFMAWHHLERAARDPLYRQLCASLPAREWAGRVNAPSWAKNHACASSGYAVV